MVKPEDVVANDDALISGNSTFNNIAAPNKATTAAAATATSSSSSSKVVTRKGYSHLFKIVLVGDSGSGKTALVKRYIHETFDGTRIYTIGVDFDIKTLTLDNGDDVKLQLWDTAGQERFRTITTSYYRGASGIVVVYDVTDKLSFDQVRKWLQEVKQYANDDTMMIVLGNKMDEAGDSYFSKDVMKEERGQSDMDDETLFQEMGIAGFFHVSAKTGEGVAHAFQELTDKLVRQKLDERNPLRGGGKVGRKKMNQREGSEGSISLHDEHHGFKMTSGKLASKKGGCCVVM